MRGEYVTVKMYAVLCRKWQRRQKGRDWYDFVWYAGNHPVINLRHLEERMRQSGHYTDDAPLSWEKFLALLHRAIEQVDIDQIRNDVAVFVHDIRQLELWNKEFFRHAAILLKPA